MSIKGGLPGCGGSVGEGRGKGEGTWGAEDPSHINIYENNTMKPLNTALKRWG
jgi:hypothetical protein